MVEADVTVGVPDISPVDVSRVRPVGRLGEIEYVGLPVKLLAVNVTGVIAEPTVADTVDTDAAMAGAPATVIVTLAVADCAPEVAVTV